MSDRKKSGLPPLWPLWLIVFFMFNIPMYAFIINLSFSGATWENALSVTSFDRMIAIMAICLLSFTLWYMIGFVRLLQRSWKELNLN